MLFHGGFVFALGGLREKQWPDFITISGEGAAWVTGDLEGDTDPTHGWVVKNDLNVSRTVEI